jgi:hypothetical protein
MPTRKEESKLEEYPSAESNSEPFFAVVQNIREMRLLCDTLPSTTPDET